MNEVFHITPSYKPAYIYGGPTLSVSRLCEALMQNGIPVMVYTTTANGKTELPVAAGQIQSVDGVEVMYAQRWTKDHTHFSPFLLWRLMKAIQRDTVVHIHSWWNLVAMPAVLICWLKGVRPVLSPRGMLSAYTFQSPIKRFLHQVGGKWLLRQTILHATAPQEATEALKVLPNWAYFVAPNIIDLPTPGHYAPTVSPEGVPLRLIFLSRIDPKKGIELLLASLATLTFDWTLEIYGTGNENYIHQLKKQATALGIDDKISWKGWIEGEARYEVLAKNDLFVLPSQNENFANVVLEALSVGTPVVISNQVGLSDYVVQKDLGWVHALDKTALTDCLLTAFEDKAKRERIQKEAPELVYNHYHPTRLVKVYVDAYARFINKK